MNADNLDARLKALMKDALANTPAAPALPPVGTAVVRPLVPRRRPAGLVWAAIGVAAAAAVAGVLAWTNRTDTHRIVAATSTSEQTPTTVPAPVWPQDLRVVIASDRGIELATAEGTGMAVTRLDQPLQGDVAFELPDGTVVSAPDLMDVGLDGQALYTGTWAGFHAIFQYPLGGTRPADPLMIPFNGEPVRLTYGTGQLVGEGTLFDGGRTPIRTTQDNQFDLSTFLSMGVVAPLGDADARLFSVSPTGRTIVWLQGNTLTVLDGHPARTLTVTDGASVTELDVSDAYVALTRGDGMGTIIDLQTGQDYEAPAAGRLTLSMRPADGSEPTPDSTPTVPGTETSNVPPSTINPIWGNGWNVLTIGDDGVRERPALGEEVVWTTEPMASAVMAPDGSLIVQRSVGVGDGQNWVWADTRPLVVTTPGATPVPLPGFVLGSGEWVRVHDAGTVNGHPLLLLERQYESNGIDTPSGSLLTFDLETGVLTTVVDRFGGWESGSSRLHLSQTGLIIGETYSEVVESFFAVALDGGWAPTATDLGVEPSYSDCSDCPRRFTISHDGTTLAWLDGTRLHVVPVAGGDMHLTYELGSAATGVADMAIGDGYVLLTYDALGQPTVPTPQVVLYAAGQQQPLPGHDATIAG